MSPSREAVKRRERLHGGLFGSEGLDQRDLHLEGLLAYEGAEVQHAICGSERW